MRCFGQKGWGGFGRLVTGNMGIDRGCGNRGGEGEGEGEGGEGRRGRGKGGRGGIGRGEAQRKGGNQYTKGRKGIR